MIPSLRCQMAPAWPPSCAMVPSVTRPAPRTASAGRRQGGWSVSDLVSRREGSELWRRAGRLGASFDTHCCPGPCHPTRSMPSCALMVHQQCSPTHPTLLPLTIRLPTQPQARSPTHHPHSTHPLTIHRRATPRPGASPTTHPPTQECLQLGRVMLRVAARGLHHQVERRLRPR